MTGIVRGWTDAPELQGKGSASWHGPERPVRTYLAEIEPR